jgi:L-rhamnose mutarotase
MKRVCFLLQVQPDRLVEYKERHKAVWPEMRQALRDAGWTNYSLFLREDGLLIGYVETENFEAARAAMQKLEVNARWQEQMSEFFVNPPGLTPDRAMEPLEEVFHLE